MAGWKKCVQIARKYEAGHQKCSKLQNGGAGASSGDPYHGEGASDTEHCSMYTYVCMSMGHAIPALRAIISMITKVHETRQNSHGSPGAREP